VVEQIHRSFLDVGVDVIETDTFRANRLTLGEYGLAKRVLEINKAAAFLARRLADEYSSKIGTDGRSPLKRFVAGSIGPSGRLPSANDPDLPMSVSMNWRMFFANRPPVSSRRG